jgi:hypothetical protein
VLHGRVCLGLMRRASLHGDSASALPGMAAPSQRTAPGGGPFCGLRGTLCARRWRVAYRRRRSDLNDRRTGILD